MPKIQFRNRHHINNRLAGGIMLLLILLISCNSSSISRSKVKELLSQHPDFSKPITEITLSRATYMEGCEQKLWVCGTPNLLPKGEEIVAEFPEGGPVELRKPIKREVIEVTGVTDIADGKSKGVEFTWRYADFPAAFARELSSPETGRQGHAFLQLYDDGWRVVRVEK